MDTTQATDSNRAKVYINGELITSYSTSTYPSLNYDNYTNSTTNHYIGKRPDVSQYLDGYLTEVNFVDGQALTPSDFGEYDDTTGVWKPKAYTGTYGTNGFYLDMSTSSSTVLDQSNNSNDWTANNMNLTTSSATTYDIMNDVATLTDEDTANFATLNPLDKGTGNLTVSDANLKASVQNYTVFGTTGVSSGKYYWELTMDTSVTYLTVGIGSASLSNNVYIYNQSPAVSYYAFDGTKFVNGTNTAYGATFTTGDVIGIALDADNDQITFYKNNTSQGTITGLTSGVTWMPVISTGSTTYTESCIANFGQRPFAYTPPTGYKKLNTYNLPDSTIKDGSQYFVPVVYTGNGVARSIDNTITDASGVETGDPIQFQPDLVWAKDRSIASNQLWNDSVRGAGYDLYSNATSAESYASTRLTSFNSNGFSLGNAVGWNANTNPYVAWNWKAGGTAVSNTDGTITSTVSANTTSGFSVVTYTGNNGASGTIGHGLGVAPSLIITKGRNINAGFPTLVNTGSTIYYGLRLNSTAANDSGAGGVFYNNTPPTSTVYTVGGSDETNDNYNYVSYCFANVEGFSKIGSYTGNGSADGPFVYTGFDVKFLLYKNTDASNSWVIYDNVRDPNGNPQSYYLIPNLNGAEGTTPDAIDFLSNGFKIRFANASLNTSGQTHIYMAFASNPFKNSLAQ
jgi:hypothetical protein